MHSSKLNSPSTCDSDLNAWFTHNDKVKAHLGKRTSVYLLPYKHHFFIYQSSDIEKIKPNSPAKNYTD